MRLIDRLTGEEAEVSDIQPNRYRVQEAGRLNSHTDLKGGDVIHGDGKKRCRLNKQIINVRVQTTNSEHSLFEDAILTISRMIASGQTSELSPLLPTSLVGNDIKSSALEVTLKSTLEAGHLHSISQRPRLDLKYEELVTEVSRAKRTANATLKHLVSHSECWQRRTLTGIIPRKVLARHSEDDYLLYENKVYASLLDALEKHLLWRLKRLSKLTKSLEAQLELQNSESVNYRLIQIICSLWGKVFDPQNMQKNLRISKLLLQEIESLLRKISGLKQRGVYKLLPRAERVSGQIHHTNILKHDPHYRHLPLLWDSLGGETTKKLQPESIFAQNKELHIAYSRYVGLVIERALDSKRLSGNWNNFQWGSKEVIVCEEQGDWVVKASCGNQLKIVPWLHYGSLSSLDVMHNTIICCPDIADERPKDSVMFGNVLPLTPFDLYVVERMGETIDKWLIRLLLEEYGKAIRPLPQKAMEALTTHSCFQMDGEGEVKCMEPPTEEIRQIMGELSGTNEANLDQIESQLKNVNQIGKCPLCHCCASSFHAEKGKAEFFAECHSCSITWLFQGGIFKQVLAGDRENEIDFSKTGRGNLEVIIET